MTGTMGIALKKWCLILNRCNTEKWCISYVFLFTVVSFHGVQPQLKISEIAELGLKCHAYFRKICFIENSYFIAILSLSRTPHLNPIVIIQMRACLYHFGVLNKQVFCRSFFVCCLAHRGSTVGFLLLQCSSGVVRHPRDLQVSVATHFCRVLIFASS